ncbi:MAG: hypothetical protein AAGL96_12370 [Pseudomonadota bacterium]
MAQITKAEAKNYGPRNGRLEFDVELELDNDAANPRTISFNVSENKHCVACYMEENLPTAAAQNTLVNAPLDTFRSAFYKFGREYAAKMVGKTFDDFDPSAAEFRICVNEMAFESDYTKIKHNDIHCYPVFVSPALTPTTVEMTRDQLEDFKSLTVVLFALSWDNVAAKKAQATRAWTRNRAFFAGLAGARNEVLSEAQIGMLDARLEKTGSVLHATKSKAAYFAKGEDDKLQAADASAAAAAAAGTTAAPYRSNG